MLQNGTRAAHAVTNDKLTGLGHPIERAISESWDRCLASGMDPSAPSIEVVVENHGLLERQQRLERVRQFVRPELELLATQIAGRNYLAAFSDTEGVILDRIIDSELEESQAAAGVVLGSNWEEKYRGTNALGLSIKTQRPALVSGIEHFFDADKGISCASSPIFNSQGEMIGLLDATSQIEERQHHTGALVNLASMNVSNRLFIEDHRDDIIIQFHPRAEYLTTQSAAMLAFDADGQLMGATQNALQLLPGLKTSHLSFEQIFFEGFGDSFSALLRGETIRLTDWMRSSLFARIRLTRSRVQTALPDQNHFMVQIPASRSQIKKCDTERDKVIFDDECLRQHMHLAVRTCSIDLPVLVTGMPNQGVSEVAKQIHRELHSDCAFYSINCELSEPNQLKLWFEETLTSSYEEASGTLFFDGVNDKWLPFISWLMDYCRSLHDGQNGTPNWIMIASTNSKSEKTPSELIENNLWGYSFEIPHLTDRSDFSAICRLILVKVSPGLVIAREAIDELRGVGKALSFTRLTKILLQASEKSSGKIIRTSDFHHLLPEPEGNLIKPCLHCHGSPAKEEKCLIIRKTLNELNGNVSLASRRLGLSRNTIYRHIGSLK